MKCISIWQPWATLIVQGQKFFETRSYPPPRTIIGQRIGIASTKNITPDLLGAYNDPEFQKFYEQSGLPELRELTFGHMLGTVMVDSFELVTEDFLEEITLEERAYGWYGLGRYAWRLRHPRPLPHPIPVQGKQGIYEWKGLDLAQSQKAEDVLEAPRGAENEEDREGQGQQRQAVLLRLHL